jgi:hypothetical protein
MNIHTYKLEEFLDRTNLDKALFFKIIEKLPKLNYETGPWLAGGAVRRVLSGQPVKDSDFDLFVASKEQSASCEQFVESNGGKLKSKNKFNSTYDLPVEEGLVAKVQIIYFQHYNNAVDVVDSFDYTICQFVTDGETLGCGEYSLFDLTRKRLAVHRISYAMSSMRRMVKYIKQGFYACPGMMADLLEKVIQNPQTLNKDIIYID